VKVGNISVDQMTNILMKRKFNWMRNAQLAVVLLCAALVKLYYSTASVNQLRWILAPTTFLVEMISGTRFEFESHAGYMNDDRSFIIAASCAGINFLITSFLMLSLSKLWKDRSPDATHKPRWRFIPVAGMFAYLATLVANTVRISTALHLNRMPPEISWLNPNQLHRFEGIFIYFGFLLLLFMVSEKLTSEAPWTSQSASFRKRTCPPRGATSGLSKRTLGDDCQRTLGESGFLRQSLFPLLVYYGTTLGIPIANGAYRQGSSFWEHSLYVLLTPLILIVPLVTFRFFRYQLAQRRRQV